MKFKIKRSILLSNLNKVSKAVSSKSPLPILSGIKFDVFEDKMVLTGSDSDIVIQATIETSDDFIIEEKGSVVLTSRYINEIIRKLDSDMIEFLIFDGELTRISGDGSEFNLNGTKAIDYPRIDLTLKGNLITMNSLLFKKIIETTIFATSDKETRPSLTGVNFKAHDQILECCATDSYRLAKKIVELNSDYNFNITIPAKSLNEISKIIENDADLNLYIDDRRVLIHIDNLVIQTRLIEAPFPDTSRLVPSTFNHILNVDSKELAGAVDRVSLFSDSSSDVIRLTLSKDNCRLNSNNQILGSAEDSLYSAIFEGEGLVISFSAKYAIDALRALDSNRVELLFTQEMAPFVIRGKGDDTNIQLLLPVKTYY